MKKFVSLLLTVVLLATMFCVFSIPASAEEYISAFGEKILEIESNETKIITESEEYDIVLVDGTLVLGENAQLTTGDLSIHKGSKFLLQQGATVKAKKISSAEYSQLVVPSGGTIKAENFELPNELTLAPDAVVEAKKLTLASGPVVEAEEMVNGHHLTVSSGATLITSVGDVDVEIDLYGTVKSSEFVENTIGKVHYHKGALLDITFKNPGDANGFIAMVDGEGVEDAAEPERFIKNENRVYIHIDHTFNNACANCGEKQGSDLTASTLSEGSLAIITAVVGIAVGFLAAMFIFKKKKPAVAEGENTDEE